MTLSLAPLLALAISVAPEPEAWHRYDVTVSPDLSQLTVHACFADGLPDQIQADHVIARSATTEMRYTLDGKTLRFAPRGNVANFRRPSDDGCIEWDSDLDRIAALDRMTVGYRANDSLLLDPASWFWRPWHLGSNRDIEITFRLPPGMSVSVPWQSLDNEFPSRRFRFGNNRFDWPSLMAIGKLYHRRIVVPGASLRMSMADGPAKPAPELAARWLRPAALAIARMTGTFPRPAPQVLVVPLDSGRDAAPWAEVKRGGGVAAHFFMNTRADWSVFSDDWIAAHELSHMAMPYVTRSDAWLSEGLASYYQNVLRARLGLLSERQAWQKLHDGFRRGHRNTGNGSLRDVTRGPQRRNNTMRIYWSGAAIALMADVELRKRTGNSWSLDRVIGEMQLCCFDNRRSWSARELFTRFDDFTGTRIFSELYAENVFSRHFPRLDETYAELGIIIGEDNRIRLDDDAAAAEIRAAIMAARTDSTDIAGKQESLPEQDAD